MTDMEPAEAFSGRFSYPICGEERGGKEEVM
jgi:hypothetical protein